MKTVGYVLAEFPVLSETFVGNEMRAMQLLGHKIQPIALQKPSREAQPDDLPLAIQTRYLADCQAFALVRLCLRHPLGFWRTIRLARQQTGVRPRSAVLTAAKIALHAKASGCQHLHAHFALHSATGALLAARWLGITASFVGHGYDVYATPSDLPFKLQQADFTIAVCQQMQQDFMAMTAQAQVELMPCGIELDKFQFQPQLKPQQRLLFIGRLAEKKGLPYLLQALAALPQSQRPLLDIVGDGPLLADITQRIEILGLNNHVKLLGAKTADWIRQHGSQYLGLVAPFQIASNGDRDTGPLVLKEAMALGLPVISSALMGCKEIVGTDTGLLVGPQDAAALASAIRHLQQQTSTEREQMVLQARRKVEQHYNVLGLCRQLSNRVEALP